VDVRLGDIVFDANDPERLAAFWSDVLGVEVAGRRGPYVVLHPLVEGPRLVFQRTDARKRSKNRVHIDLRVQDPRVVQAHVEALDGATLPAYTSGGFLVMADPEGNEFCLLPMTGTNLDDDGTAHYLETSTRS
jgi:predicted enzyme related to lactoylglutathione lyase